MPVSPSHFPYAVFTRNLLVALALGQLAACATELSHAPSAPPVAALDAGPTEVAPVFTPPAPPQQVASEPSQAMAEPIIIRGSDRVIAAPPAAPAIKGAASSYKFEDAPSTEVVNVMLRDILKVDYVVYPPLPGTITLATRGTISADRALLLLENALQVSGIVMARDARGVYHVGKPEALRGIVAAPQVVGNGALAPGYGAIIYPLQYLGASEMASILRPMVPADAIVRVDTTRNILIMQGTRAQAEGWTELVNTFDVNILRGMSVGVFPLKHSSAAEVDNALRLMVGAATGAAPAAGAATAGATRSGTTAPSPANPTGEPAIAGASNPLYGALRIMPIERINAVLVITPRAAYLDEVRYWIEQFDRPNMSSAEPQLFVYKIQNGSATHLAELLNGIYGGGVHQQPGATGATGIAPGLAGATGVAGGAFGASAIGGPLAGGTSPFGSGAGSTFGGGMGSRFGSGAGSTFGSGGGFGSNIGGLVGSAGINQPRQSQQQGGNVVTTTLGQSVRVMADRINNTLLVHATPAEYQRIEATLKRLDIQRAQVLIEATIIEVTLGDGLQYGLQWAFNNGGLGGNRTGAGVLNNSTTSLTPGSGGRYGFAGAAAQGFTYAISNGAGNIAAMLSALANKSLIKVISSPSLLVLDNHTATMAVGNQQPINIGTTVATTGNIATTNNIQYKDTGVMLGVTPSVSAGDLVTLDINQAVTDVGPTDPITGQVTFLQRQINSQVAVRSGETLALGGLIKDNTGRTSSGLPILSSIPVIGGLFGTQSKTNTRTELLVVFTPRVVRSDDDARAISRELRDRMRGLTMTRPDALP